MTHAIQLRRATAADAPLLARFNRRLIEDEGSRNPMSPGELEARMRGWLAGGWTAVLVTLEGEAVGYALFQVRADEYDADLREVYVRQFYIAPSQRRRGIGRMALERLADEFFPAGATLVLEVLASNPAAGSFWQALGFAPYAVTWKRPPASMPLDSIRKFAD